MNSGSLAFRQRNRILNDRVRSARWPIERRFLRIDDTRFPVRFYPAQSTEVNEWRSHLRCSEFLSQVSFCSVSVHIIAAVKEMVHNMWRQSEHFKPPALELLSMFGLGEFCILRDAKKRVPIYKSNEWSELVLFHPWHKFHFQHILPYIPIEIFPGLPLVKRFFWCILHPFCDVPGTRIMRVLLQS